MCPIHWWLQFSRPSDCDAVLNIQAPPTQSCRGRRPSIKAWRHRNAFTSTTTTTTTTSHLTTLVWCSTLSENSNLSIQMHLSVLLSRSNVRMVRSCQQILHAHVSSLCTCPCPCQPMLMPMSAVGILSEMLCLIFLCQAVDCIGLQRWGQNNEKEEVIFF